MSDPSFARGVYRAVRRVPYGRVVSYGGVAALAGAPRAARGVGRALRALPQGSDVPWWRVVGSGGRISLRGPDALLQRTLLEAEGVSVGPGGRVDWRRFAWDGATTPPPPPPHRPPRPGSASG